MSPHTHTMFHSNQTYAANSIRSSFLSGTRYALLSAKCQSGKTGTFQSLIKAMLDAGDVTHAYVLCGSAETELKRQAVSDTLAFNAAYQHCIQVVFHPVSYTHLTLPTILRV